MRADTTKTLSDLLRQLGFDKKLVDSLGADGDRRVAVNVEMDDAIDMLTIGRPRPRRVKATVRVTWMIHDSAE